MTKPSDPATEPTIAPHGDAAIAATEAPGLRGATMAIPDAGYTLGELLGRGGMGEVLLARDRRIGRDVAIKRMRSASPSPEALARFLREARIQARLDHPAIVPVHELGHDAEGRPYFTMKRLAGTTLMAVLASGALPQQQLLRNFVEVCLAIEFAHSRGVVHRDLKPANIMLGDFGEVYVLDWGVARATEDDAPADDTGVQSLDGETQAGSLLGTPGYMAPEQIRGEPVDGRADVYALGCILFEILAGEPLHPRNGSLASTLEHPSGSEATRAKLDVAPELDTACLSALAGAPEARPSARGLAAMIQRYLDGDRDLGRRRELAAEELVRAHAAIAVDDRATAMASAGRALALDPESRSAARLVTALLLEPPRALPTELEHHLVAVDEHFARRQWRVAALALASFLLFVPLMIWQGVVDWTSFAVLMGLMVVTIAFAELNHRRLRRYAVPCGLALNFAICVVLNRVLGSFMLVPGVITVIALSWMSYPATLARPWPAVIVFLAAFIVPLILEATGVLTSTWKIEGDVIGATPAMLTARGPLTAVLLVSSALGTTVVAFVMARALALTRRDALHKSEIQAWHLRKLLPAER